MCGEDNISNYNKDINSEPGSGFVIRRGLTSHWIELCDNCREILELLGIGFVPSFPDQCCAERA